MQKQTELPCFVITHEGNMVYSCILSTPWLATFLSFSPRLKTKMHLGIVKVIETCNCLPLRHFHLAWVQGFRCSISSFNYNLLLKSAMGAPSCPSWANIKNKMAPNKIPLNWKIIIRNFQKTICIDPYCTLISEYYPRPLSQFQRYFKNESKVQDNRPYT